MNIVKTLKVASWMGRYLSEATVIRLSETDPNLRLERLAKNVSRYARRALKSLNIKVEMRGLELATLAGRNFLIVSNHMSYLDVLIIASVWPSVFVTSVDMGEKPFLGTMIELGGCILIERRNRERVEFDKSAIVRTLSCGHNVVLYPEGTSTDGSRILPFKKSLLMAAGEAGVDLLPVAIRYSQVNGKKFDFTNHAKLCWYGEMSFLPHLLGVTGLQSVTAEVHILKPISVDTRSTRDELAAKSHAAISHAYFETEASL